MRQMKIFAYELLTILFVCHLHSRMIMDYKIKYGRPMKNE